MGRFSELSWKEFFVNEGPMYTFVLAWMITNAIIFATTYVFYDGPQYAYLRWIVGKGLPMARGAASCLNLNCALLLIPVCRNLINFLRGAFECRRSVRRLFDKNILFHKTCAYTICVFAIVHIASHVFNVNALVLSDGKYEEVQSGDTAEAVALTSIPGGTGVGITLCLIFIVTTASEQIRRSYFELFWYTHHLFIVFYVLLCVHGISGFVRKQTNFIEVPSYEYQEKQPVCCDRFDPACQGLGCLTWDMVDAYYQEVKAEFNLPITDGESVQCIFEQAPPADVYEFCCPCREAIIQTQNGGPATWQWLVGPLGLYILERLYRFYNTITRRLRVLKVVKHQDAVPVMEVQFEKIPTKAGQYIFIHCPAVSHLEWHPFTLTSCPELPYTSLHIRLVGDWTTAFAEKLGFFEDDAAGKALKLPYVNVDGPFGTASEDIFRFEAGVCVAAGIGVTPFASLLQALYFRKSDPNNVLYNNFKTQKVYFYWICPGFNAWGWFAQLLIDMEEKLDELGESDFLSINVFMSRGWNQDDAAKIMLQEDEEGDLIVRDKNGRALRHKMNFGRPMWDKEFGDIAANHPNTDVGVFFCGPKVLSQQLHRNCNKFTHQCAAQRTRFFYGKENF